MSDIALYGFWRSSSTHRVQIALRLKALRFTYQSVHLGRREQESEAFLAINPAAQVPVLEIDGLRLTQSMAILAYLDVRFPERGPSLSPRDPTDYARAWEIAERINSFLQPFQMPGGVRRPLLKLLDRDGPEGEAAMRDFARAQLTGSLSLLDAQIATTAGRYAVGDALSVADLTLIPQLSGAARFGVDTARFSTLMRVYAACMDVRAFQEAAPERQPDAPAS